MNEDVRAFRALLHSDLFAFVERAFPELDPRTPLILAPYLELLISSLMQAAAGAAPRLIINLPPRHLKSLVTSVIYSAWLLGRDPQTRIGVISHSQQLARDLALKTLRLVQSPFYRAVFPHTCLRQERHQAMDFETTEGGGRYAASLDTGVTGRGFDHIIVDDPISAHDARSSAERERVKDAYDGMIASRLDQPTKGSIVVVGQWLHEDDLSGHLLTKSGWKHLCLPLVAEEPTTYQLDGRIWQRQAGEALLPETWPASEIEKTRLNIGAANFSAQYQQNPSAAVGELIRPDQIGLFDQLPAVNRTVLTWDTAAKVTSSSSYTACLVVSTDWKRHYVRDVLRRRLDPVEVRDAAFRLIQQYQPDVILIEDASSGPGLERMLNEAGHRVDLRRTGGRSKEERLEAHLHMFVEGRILVQCDQPWTTGLINELSRFPFSRYDDQTDAMSQYLDWIKEQPVHPPIFFGTHDSSLDRMARYMLGRSLQRGEHPMRPRKGGLRRRLR